MNELRMVVSPGPSATRVIAFAEGPTRSETLLKARLSAEPSHPRAVQWLLEAVALWEGRPVRAALCADASARTYVTRLYPAWFTDFGTALYTLEVAEPRTGRRARHRDALRGMGDYADLRQLSLSITGASR